MIVISCTKEWLQLTSLSGALLKLLPSNLPLTVTCFQWPSVLFWPSAVHSLSKQAVLNSHLYNTATNIRSPGWPLKTDMTELLLSLAFHFTYTWFCPNGHLPSTAICLMRPVCFWPSTVYSIPCQSKLSKTATCLTQPLISGHRGDRSRQIQLNFNYYLLYFNLHIIKQFSCSLSTVYEAGNSWEEEPEDPDREPSPFLAPYPDALHHLSENFLTVFHQTHNQVMPLRKFLDHITASDLRQRFGQVSIMHSLKKKTKARMIKKKW
jgi:hypothetical protein